MSTVPMILQEPDSSIQSLTERLAAEAGQTLRSRIRVAGFDAVCHMAQAGLGVGIGIVPDYSVSTRASAMHIAEVPLEDTWANRLHMTDRPTSTCLRANSNSCCVNDEALLTALRDVLEDRFVACVRLHARLEKINIAGHHLKEIVEIVGHAVRELPVGTVVNELVANAIEHAFPDGVGRIEVVLAPNPDGSVEIHVDDNGRGRRVEDSSTAKRAKAV